MNLYAYVRNNPLALLDPMGLRARLGGQNTNQFANKTQKLTQAISQRFGQAETDRLLNFAANEGFSIGFGGIVSPGQSARINGGVIQVPTRTRTGIFNPTTGFNPMGPGTGTQLTPTSTSAQAAATFRALQQIERAELSRREAIQRALLTDSLLGRGGQINVPIKPREAGIPHNASFSTNVHIGGISGGELRAIQRQNANVIQAGQGQFVLPVPVGSEPSSFGYALDGLLTVIPVSKIINPKSFVGTGGADDLITVRHFTGSEGRQGISRSGSLRSDTFVTLPTEISPRAGHLQVERALEIAPGRGTNFIDVDVLRSNLRIPNNGATTSRGKLQFQLNDPIYIDPNNFRRTPGRPTN